MDANGIGIDLHSQCANGHIDSDRIGHMTRMVTSNGDRVRAKSLIPLRFSDALPGIRLAWRLHVDDCPWLCLGYPLTASGQSTAPRGEGPAH